MMTMNTKQEFCRQMVVSKCGQTRCFVNTKNDQLRNFNSRLSAQRHDFSKRGNVKMVRSTMLNEGCRYPMLTLDYMSCQFTSSSQEKEKGVRFSSNSLIFKRFRMGLNQRPPD